MRRRGSSGSVPMLVAALLFFLPMRGGLLFYPTTSRSGSGTQMPALTGAAALMGVASSDGQVEEKAELGQPGQLQPQLQRSSSVQTTRSRPCGSGCMTDHSFLKVEYAIRGL